MKYPLLFALVIKKFPIFSPFSPFKFQNSPLCTGLELQYILLLLVILRKNGYILSICTAARISFFFDFFRLFNFNHKTLLFPPFKSFLNVKRWAGWSLHANRIKAVIVNIRKINTQFTRTLEKLNKNTFEPYSTTL